MKKLIIIFLTLLFFYCDNHSEPKKAGLFSSKSSKSDCTILYNSSIPLPVGKMPSSDCSMLNLFFLLLSQGDTNAYSNSGYTYTGTGSNTSTTNGYGTSTTSSGTTTCQLSISNLASLYYSGIE